MAARHRAAARAKFAEGGMVKKGPDIGGVISEAESPNEGFKKGGRKHAAGGAVKLQTGGIASGAALAPRLDKAPRRAAGGRVMAVPMKRGGSPYSAAKEMTPAKASGSECADAGD